VPEKASIKQTNRPGFRNGSRGGFSMQSYIIEKSEWKFAGWTILVSNQRFIIEASK
jgi:hypothetical protein